MNTMERRGCKYYDDRAGGVNLEDITSSENNENILRKLRNGELNWDKRIFITNEFFNDDNEFVVGDGDDCGWLGYFIGRSLLLQELYIWHLPQETAQIELFVEGLNRNQSIEKLSFCADNGGVIFEKMTPFFRSNRNLHHLYVQFHIGFESSLTSLTPMIDYMSLRIFCLEGRALGDGNSLTDEDGIVVDIIKALSKQTRLEVLHLESCNIGRNACDALGSLLNSRVSILKDLSLFENSIDDEGLESLVAGMAGCSNLTELNLGVNRQISIGGLVSLSTLFQCQCFRLERVDLTGIRIDDEGAKALADGLVGNTSLKVLHFSYDSVTSSGWSAFSRLLCDTSSINNTFSSNHTIDRIGSFFYDVGPPDILQYLEINSRREHAAIYKILMNHSVFDMQPLFRWKLKFVPLVVNWFDARVETLDFVYLAELTNSFRVDKVSGRMGSRKLSAVYQFIRGMPLFVVDCYRGEKMIGTKKRKFDRRD